MQLLRHEPHDNQEQQSSAYQPERIYLSGNFSEKVMDFKQSICAVLSVAISGIVMSPAWSQESPQASSQTNPANLRPINETPPGWYWAFDETGNHLVMFYFPSDKDKANYPQGPVVLLGPEPSRVPDSILEHRMVQKAHWNKYNASKAMRKADEIVRHAVDKANQKYQVDLKHARRDQQNESIQPPPAKAADEKAEKQDEHEPYPKAEPR